MKTKLTAISLAYGKKLSANYNFPGKRQLNFFYLNKSSAKATKPGIVIIQIRLVTETSRLAYEVFLL